MMAILSKVCHSHIVTILKAREEFDYWRYSFCVVLPQEVGPTAHCLLQEQLDMSCIPLLLPFCLLQLLNMPGIVLSSSLCQGLRYYRTVALAKEPAKSRPGHCDLDSPQPINCQCEMPHHNYLFMIIFLSSVVILKGRVQNSRSWLSQVKSTNQITRNQGNTGHTRRHHNQASRIFNTIGCW